MSRSSGWIAVFVVAVGFGEALEAQDSKNPGRVGRRSLLPKAEEIALARSGAPSSVSDSASIWIFTDAGYELATKGSSGGACYVSRSWPASIEPHCFDEEGAETIMKIHMREVELMHAGMSVDDVDRSIGADLANGRLRLPRRPAVSYMMSAGQKLIGDTGQPSGAWRPHIMIYYPYLESTDLYSGSPDLASGMVTGSGTATSSIMFLVPEFVKVRTPVP